MDKSVQPGDSFYKFANGAWDARTEIPSDKSNYGMFTVLDDLSRDRTKQIIEEQARDPNSRIGAVYASFMNEAAVEAKGLTPFEPWLNQVRGIESKSQLRPSSASALRSAASSTRTTRRRISTSSTSSRPAWACRTATII
jgi:putative endopeptidase